MKRIDGHYIPGLGALPKEIPEEDRLLVINLFDDPYFFDTLKKLSEHFNQDAFLFKAKDEEVAYLYGTNRGNTVGYGKVKAGTIKVSMDSKYVSHEPDFEFVPEAPERPARQSKLNLVKMKEWEVAEFREELSAAGGPELDRRTVDVYKKALYGPGAQMFAESKTNRTFEKIEALRNGEKVTISKERCWIPEAQKEDPLHKCWNSVLEIFTPNAFKEVSTHHLNTSLDIKRNPDKMFVDKTAGTPLVDGNGGFIAFPANSNLTPTDLAEYYLRIIDWAKDDDLVIFAWSFGNYIQGEHKTDLGNAFNEESICLEVLNVDYGILLDIASMLITKFKQKEALVKFENDLTLMNNKNI